MNRHRVLAACLLVGGVSLSSQAATVSATGGVYGGPKQHRAYCYLFNAGRKVIRLKSAAIIRQDGTVLEHYGCHFPAPVPPPLAVEGLGTCLIWNEIQNDSTYACRFVTEGNNPNLRGTLDIRDAEENVLTSSPLR